MKIDLSILLSPVSDPAQTRVCIESLLRTLPPKLNWELLVFESSESLAAPHDRVRILPALADAPGLAAARNAAVSAARAPRLCFLSPSAVLMSGWLPPMLRLLRRAPSAGCVGNVQREPYSGLIDHAGIRFDADGLPVAFWANQPLLPRERHDRHPAVSLACALVSREVFDRVGGFDEQYHGPLGDVDFCLRAATLGYRHYVANRSTIYCYHHTLPAPSPAADFALFRTRWGARARAAHVRRTALLATPASAPPSAEAWEMTREQRRLWRQRVGDTRHEGGAYLRKHLHRPWRYNYERVCRALAKALQPKPAALPPTPGPTTAPIADTDRPDDGWLFDPPAAAMTNGPVFYVCGDTAANPARSGIQTVVRSLLAAFGASRAPVRPVAWRLTGAYLRPLRANRSLGLGAEPLRDPPTHPWEFLRHPAAWPALLLAGGDPERVPLPVHPRYRSAPPGGWVLLPELVYHEQSARQLVDYVHRQGWRLAAILHDAIPVEHPEYVSAKLTADHHRYLRALSRADLILPNSEATAQSWHAFVACEKLPSPPVVACPLACDLPGIPRVRAIPAPHDGPVRMLCVSTLEPRKNHRTLFEAYELAVARRPDPSLTLDLVGSSYENFPEIAAAARALVARHPGRVRWHERVEHGALQALYAACDFSVYPSLVEGFGLPVIESLWFARPCVCASFGVMAENAAGGGCLTCDVRDPHTLADAIPTLAADPALRTRLAQEAATRPLKTWAEYAQDILDALQSQR